MQCSICALGYATEGIKVRTSTESNLSVSPQAFSPSPRHECRVQKGTGSQLVVRYMSTYSGGLASARHLYRAAAKLWEAAQLCVSIRHLYLPVLRRCLGMGVQYAYSSSARHFTV